MSSARADSPRIAAIVLAAGRSQRFGRTRINKLLAPLAGKTVLQQVLDTLARSAARPLVVVSGHQHRRIGRLLRGGRRAAPKLRFNRHHRRGMASSLQAGLRALPDDIDGALVCLGDMPGLSRSLIDTLIAAFDPDYDAVIPRCDGRRGNPVLLNRRLFPGLHDLGGDEGARRLLARSKLLRFVETDAAVLQDIDTRRDWRRAVARGGRR